MKENIIADIDSIISTKESMDGYCNELLSMINWFQEIIEDTQNIYYTESATLYRKIAINYIEFVRNYINNDFKEFIDRIDEVKKIYLDEVEDTSYKLVHYSNNEIANKINDLKNAVNNFVWEGPASAVFLQKYNIKIEKMIQMNESLANIGKFLLNVKDNYSDVNRKRDNSFNEGMGEVEKGGGK